MRLDPEILRLMRIEAKRHRLAVVDFTRVVIESYFRGVGGVTSPPTPYLGVDVLRRAVLAKIKGLLGQLRFEIATVDVVKIRERRIKQLEKAIDDLHVTAQAVEPNERLRFYQLMGYLCMVLDGIANNVAKGELLRRLDAVEERLDVGLEGDRASGEKRGGKDRASKR